MSTKLHQEVQQNKELEHAPGSKQRKNALAISSDNLETMRQGGCGHEGAGDGRLHRTARLRQSQPQDQP
ncbi:hypothetical protein [Bosea sp. (in: a-proteobacteria)]|jgi:hypothetical protein|uniref:hypothetical protein n=1 Tax=Bosea sp. (in: a-proteobacteria) TaxID=1871050 RepID=UPI001ACD2F6A|nr:hypothetical protein [Bosea sp. (in: a-proteobacteria)]MBN9440501.1 hypothetical protein [Bosea sp. (in: a-proteobacteria)]